MWHARSCASSTSDSRDLARCPDARREGAFLKLDDPRLYRSLGHAGRRGRGRTGSSAVPVLGRIAARPSSQAHAVLAISASSAEEYAARRTARSSRTATGRLSRPTHRACIRSRCATDGEAASTGRAAGLLIVNGSRHHVRRVYAPNPRRSRIEFSDGDVITLDDKGVAADQRPTSGLASLVDLRSPTATQSTRPAMQKIKVGQNALEAQHARRPWPRPSSKTTSPTIEKVNRSIQQLERACRRTSSRLPPARARATTQRPGGTGRPRPRDGHRGEARRQHGDARARRRSRADVRLVRRARLPARSTVAQPSCVIPLGCRWDLASGSTRDRSHGGCGRTTSEDLPRREHAGPELAVAGPRTALLY